MKFRLSHTGVKIVELPLHESIFAQYFALETVTAAPIFWGGDGEITDEEGTRLLTENKEEHMEICRCLVLPSFKAHIIVHNAAEDAPRSGQLLKH